MCSLTTECVLLLQNVFSYYIMCSLTTECVLVSVRMRVRVFLTTDCVLLLQNVFSYYRMCSLTYLAYVSTVCDYNTFQKIAIGMPRQSARPMTHVP